MTEQQTGPRIPAHAQTLMLSAAQEAHHAATWAAKECFLGEQLTEHQQAANAELGELAAQIDALRNRYERRRLELEETGSRIAADLADAGRRKGQHHDDAEDARQSVLDWCTRHGIDPAALPPVPTGEASGALPVMNGTGPQPAVISGGHPMLTADQIRVQQNLPPRGEQRPALPEGDTTTTRADTPLPVSPGEPGGDPAPAEFHRGDPSPGQEQADA